MEKIKKLKKNLKELNLDGYLIPKNDEFFSEYVPLHKMIYNTLLIFQDRMGWH